jgi:secondary thiamine-phosphate synthase enzyme
MSHAFNIFCKRSRNHTGAVMINENIDPDVSRDILEAFERAVPLRVNYRHTEGNFAAHIQSSLVGASELVIIENGRLILGIRESIFFCEFEGFRTRKVIIKFINTKQIKKLSFK